PSSAVFAKELGGFLSDDHPERPLPYPQLSKQNKWTSVPSSICFVIRSYDSNRVEKSKPSLLHYLLLCNSLYASLFEIPISFATFFNAAFSSVRSSDTIC